MYLPVIRSLFRSSARSIKYRDSIAHHKKSLYFTLNNSVRANYIHISVQNLNNMTNYSESYIKEKLAKELEPVHLDVVDYSDGCGAKFNVVIVSTKFEGKSLLERHRMVNGILDEEMKTIHAFTQKTLTPEQWKKLQES